MSDGIQEIEVDAKVVLQIIKHGQDDSRSSPNCLDGYLTGFTRLEKSGKDSCSVTEVTNSFRSLSAEGLSDEEYFRMSASYQSNMLHRLREQSQDHILVGLYRKVQNFNFMTKPDDLLNFMEFQSANDQQSMQTGARGTIMLVYDEKRMSNGDFGLRGYRCSDKAMKMFQDHHKNQKKSSKQKNPFAVSNIQEHGLSVAELLVELPISIKSSHLMNCLMHQIENTRMEDIEKQASGSLTSRGGKAKYDSALMAPAYNIASTSNLQDQTELMKNCVEEVHADTGKFISLQRGLHNATIKKHQIIASKERENSERVANGDKPLNIDIDEIEKTVKMPEEHNRLGGMVHTFQANLFCEAVKNLSAGNMGKLYLAESVTNN